MSNGNLLKQIANAARSSDFLKAWAVAGSINVATTQLMLEGLRRGKVSDTVPFLSLSPIFLLPTGYLLLGELPRAGGALGVAAVSLGGLWLSHTSLTHEAKCKTVPGSMFQRTLSLPPGSGIYILVAALHSVSSAFDKLGVRAASPLLYGAAVSTTVSICAAASYARSAFNPVPNKAAADPPEHLAPARMWGLLLAASGLKLSSYWFQLKSNVHLQSAHVSAIRKAGVLVVLLLSRVLFGERVKHKLPPVSLMVLGVLALTAAK